MPITTSKVLLGFFSSTPAIGRGVERFARENKFGSPTTVIADQELGSGKNGKIIEKRARFYRESCRHSSAIQIVQEEVRH